MTAGRNIEVEQLRQRQRYDARVDRLVRRHSARRFTSLRHMATTPDYVPSLRAEDPKLTEIADAYDALQQSRGDPRRACR